MSKLISTLKIKFDDETKAEIRALKGKLDKVALGLSVKNESSSLLETIQAWSAEKSKAANDDHPELKELGQWVFEGQDESWIGAAVDGSGEAYLYTCLSDKVVLGEARRYFIAPGELFKKIGDNFDVSNWRESAINRETVNDVDYLSDNDLDDSVPHIDDVLALPNWLSGYAGVQITQADIQLIFIKKLSDVLIQRMHSMNRFSEDDYAIGGGDLIAWDIVFEPLTRSFGIFFGKTDAQRIGSFVFFTKPSKLAVNWDVNKAEFIKSRTITELELKDFRTVLEACYA